MVAAWRLQWRTKVKWTLVALLASCTSSSGGNDDGMGPDAWMDAGVDAYCHWDCFGHTECRNGQVTQWAHTPVPVPCDLWTGQCPIQGTLMCSQGCRVEGVDVQQPFFTNLAALCRESPARAAGDPCENDSDCLPTPATVNADGTVTNYYLRCDFPNRRCVVTPEPSVSGWLGACPSVDLTSFRGTGRHGSAESACPGGYCLFADDTTAGCVRQGCSAGCTGDQDCPLGAICSDQLDYWRQGSMYPRVPVCKPGAPAVFGVGLMCF
jgi:hypothetical protein